MSGKLTTPRNSGVCELKIHRWMVTQNPQPCGEALLPATCALLCHFPAVFCICIAADKPPEKEHRMPRPTSVVRRPNWRVNTNYPQQHQMLSWTSYFRQGSINRRKSLTPPKTALCRAQAGDEAKSELSIVQMLQPRHRRRQCLRQMEATPRRTGGCRPSRTTT